MEKKPKPNILKQVIKDCYYSAKVLGKPKIFGIGANKTGTTSLRREMELNGYVVGKQKRAELLFDYWVKRDFRPIIRYCRTAQFFQDAPFSYPFTFIALDKAYPNSKFILTIRDNPEQWYQSLINFHGKIWGNGNVPPTKEDLLAANYLYKGFPYYSLKNRIQVDDNDMYNKEILIGDYNRHNKNVIDYFRHRPKDLLVLNIAEKGSYKKLVEFLGIESDRTEFPWENKT